MTSSSKVIKAHQQTLARQRMAVEVPEMEEPVVIEPEMETAFSELVDRAKREARAIMEQAETDAQKARQEAMEEGYQTGYREGQEAGKDEARAMWADLRRNIEEPLKLLAQSREYLDRLNDESTLALAAALTMAVFTRLKLERLDVIAGYIAELAETVDKERVTVFLDPSWGPRLAALEEVLKDSIKGLALAVDDSLAPGVMRADGNVGGAVGGPLLSLKALLQEVLG
jgi:flagellar assembly protein FliH